MDKVTNIPIVELNPLLTCSLCKGYIIDATTVIECLHSFCRTCIVNYLVNHNVCPVCDTLLHKTRPYCAIRPDTALQAIVYKLLPKVFEREMSSRRKFYGALPHGDRVLISPEKRGDITLNTYVEKEEERVSLELRFWRDRSSDGPSQSSLLIHPSPIYLLCPPSLTVGHLEKLLRNKFNLSPDAHNIEFFFVSVNCPKGGERFTSDFTISDLVCIYSCTQSWTRVKKNGCSKPVVPEAKPMRLYFSVHPGSAVAAVNGGDEVMANPNSMSVVTSAAAPVANSNAIALSTG
ncbi:unnamed protein product [Hymenolepis diminuta]|uniref:RING-type domain-containing protein n=1 Tax=Hymenolepis diminuta TaxID=6216 RepID=A0A564ZA19_HYMDI|nr:unnamed protein product [Hymenolepis diminuta]